MRKLLLRSLGWAAAFGFMAVSAHAGDALFSPLDAGSPSRQALGLDRSYQALANSPASASLDLVRANTNLLTDKAKTLTLNLAPGLELRAHQTESYFSKSGNLVWSGVL